MILFQNFAEERSVELLNVSGCVPVKTGNARRGVLKFSCSIADIHSCWYSFLPAPGERIPWKLEVSFAAQRGMPFVSLFNMGGVNKFSVGLVDCDCDSRFSGEMNQETGCCDITWEISSREGIPDFCFWYDAVGRPWQEEIFLWRSRLSGIGCEFPRSVWDPVFCTWYAVHGAVTQAWCSRTAKKASALGFKTFILDDGWCYPDMKRVSPSTAGTWYEKVGDWRFDRVKFPDFRSHVDEVHKLGMKYMVWVAPYLVGAESAMYRKLKDTPGALFGDVQEGYVKLEPGNPAGARPVLDLMEDLMREWGLDGLKVDFLDQIYPDPDFPRATECYNFTAELSRRIRRHNKDAMIEFRQSYAVPRMLGCGTQFRAGDAPFDFLLNLQRIAQIRLAVGDGIPVHADPAYWPEDELPVNISRHFIAMMAGVPMLSVDLEKLTPEAESICRFWIAFYNGHLRVFGGAHWEFDYSGGRLGCAKALTDDRELAIVTDSRRMPVPEKPGWILNLSPAPLAVPGAEVFDWNGGPVEGDMIPEGCGAFVKN